MHLIGLILFPIDVCRNGNKAVQLNVLAIHKSPEMYKYVCLLMCGLTLELRKRDTPESQRIASF